MFTFFILDMLVLFFIVFTITHFHLKHRKLSDVQFLSIVIFVCCLNVFILHNGLNYKMKQEREKRKNEPVVCYKVKIDDSSAILMIPRDKKHFFENLKTKGNENCLEVVDTDDVIHMMVYGKL